MKTKLELEKIKRCAALLGEPADEVVQSLVDEVFETRVVAEALWQLLDDINTLDAVCGANDAWYRKAVEAHQQKRHEHIRSDGHHLYWPGEEMSATAPPAPWRYQKSLTP
jgi:hypothetical protein